MNPPNSTRGAQLTGYKLPPVVYPGATVTMTIARDARSFVVQQNPWSPRQGSLSVTYRACLHKRGFFPQSFRFTDGRRRGCVPSTCGSMGSARRAASFSRSSLDHAGPHPDPSAVSGFGQGLSGSYHPHRSRARCLLTPGRWSSSAHSGYGRTPAGCSVTPPTPLAVQVFG